MFNKTIFIIITVAFSCLSIDAYASAGSGPTASSGTISGPSTSHPNLGNSQMQNRKSKGSSHNHSAAGQQLNAKLKAMEKQAQSHKGY